MRWMIWGGGICCAAAVGVTLSAGWWLLPPALAIGTYDARAAASALGIWGRVAKAFLVLALVEWAVRLVALYLAGHPFTGSV